MSYATQLWLFFLMVFGVVVFPGIDALQAGVLAAIIAATQAGVYGAIAAAALTGWEGWRRL
jgi:ATP/ADP translocase